MPDMQQTWAKIRDVFFWAPDWLSGVAILTVAAAAAIIINLLVFSVLRRFDEEQHPFLRLLRRRIKGLTGFALVAFALAAALQWAPFNPTVAAALSHLLLIAFIVLAGWIAHNAVEPAARLYLLRFG